MLVSEQVFAYARVVVQKNPVSLQTLNFKRTKHLFNIGASA